MQENAPQAATGAASATPAADVAMDEDEDPELAAALAMSMAEPQPGTSTEVRCLWLCISMSTIPDSCLCSFYPVEVGAL